MRNNKEVTSENSRDDYNGFDENLDTYDLGEPISELKQKLSAQFVEVIIARSS